jgi:hypothetical protein
MLHSWIMEKNVGPNRVNNIKLSFVKYKKQIMSCHTIFYSIDLNAKICMILS